MIVRLRRRLTLLVIVVLATVTAGIVAAISITNYRAVDLRAYAALRTLARNQGQRPGMRDWPEPDAPAPPDAMPGDEAPPMPDPGDFGSSFASMANFYVADIDAGGGVTGWTSDRADLYDDEQVSALAQAALSTGGETGRIGAQYFRVIESEGGRQLIVLDARLERLAARSVMRTTALVAALACLILSLGARLLIGQMVKPVEAAFERQKQFAWDASHEFKTPLAVISANAEVLEQEIGKNEYLGYIQSEVRRTDRLVQSLLTLARMDKGTVTAHMERFDLSKALMGVALPFESTVFEAGRTLETDIPEDVFIRGDCEMLQQLAVILLSNALKYSDDHGLIRLSLCQKGHGCRFSVYNTGPGIAPENLERIFDRFYREDLSHSGEIGSNGLGLAIARNIAEVHKGKIWAESEYGKSAEFIVTLP